MSVPSFLFKIMLKKIAQFLQESRSELKKVSWPDRKQAIRLTAVVITVSLIVGLFIGIVDFGLNKGLEVLIRR